MERKSMDLKKTPLILKQTEKLGFRDPAACYHKGTICLYFTMVHQEKRGQYFSIGMCKSTDLIHWNEPVELTGKELKEECFGPGNLFFHAGIWYLCMQIRCRENGERADGKSGRRGRICIMRTGGLEHFEEPVPLEITGEDVSAEEMADRSDPYLFRNKDDPEIIWYLYRMNNERLLARSEDLKKWTCVGSVPYEENACVRRPVQDLSFPGKRHRTAGIR